MHECRLRDAHPDAAMHRKRRSTRAPPQSRLEPFSSACTASLRARRIIYTVFTLVPCAISLKKALEHFSLSSYSRAHVNRRLFVLIPCSGAGMRASASLPKQYQWIVRRPLLYRTLSASNASRELAQITLVRGP